MYISMHTSFSNTHTHTSPYDEGTYLLAKSVHLLCIHVFLVFMYTTWVMDMLIILIVLLLLFLASLFVERCCRWPWKYFVLCFRGTCR